MPKIIRLKITEDILSDLLVIAGVQLFLLSFFVQAIAGMFLFLSLHVEWVKRLMPTYVELSLGIFRFGEDFRTCSIIFAGTVFIIAFMILTIKKNYRE